MRTPSFVFLAALAAGACGDGGVQLTENPCNTVPLPLAGDAGGPVLEDVGLEVQPGEGIILFATATDPDGSENLTDVQQSISVFPDARCQGTPVTLTDDLAGSGVEETFGTAVSVADNASWYAAIAAASRWPVEVDFTDLDGNRTQGRVLARVVR